VGFRTGALEGVVSRAQTDVPRVSVVLPAFNAADSVRRSLESVLVQTWRDLEVIVVDDASQDETSSVVRAVAASDRRVVAVRNDHNVGAAASRNRAIRRARGEWLAFLDADDWWAPERLQRMLASAQDADAVSDDLRIVAAGSAGDAAKGHSFLEHIGLRIGAPRELTLLEFVKRDLGLLHPIIRRRLLAERGLGFDERFEILHDFPLWILLLAAGARWIQLPDAYYYYSRASEALSTRQRLMVEEVIENTDALLHEPALASDPDVLAALRGRRREWEGHAAFLTVGELLKRRKPAALARVLASHPGFVPLIVRRQLRHLKLRLTRRAQHPRRSSPARLL